MASKCDSCHYLKNRINGRKIMCKAKGLANQRTEQCNEYAPKVEPRVSMLDWIGV